VTLLTAVHGHAFRHIPPQPPSWWHPHPSPGDTISWIMGIILTLTQNTKRLKKQNKNVKWKLIM